ncbi:MAG: hypothetical protein RL100_834 [Actinomycetota bacterium]|jgi:hypothetical protein
MSQQTMRGMRLGSQSLESELGVNYSARTVHSFQCANGHVSEITFAADAEVPQVWQCKNCSKQSVLVEAGKQVELELVEEKAGRSHLEMLLERRSREELEEILEERIEYIRGRRAKGQADL